MYNVEELAIYLSSYGLNDIDVLDSSGYFEKFEKNNESYMGQVDGEKIMYRHKINDKEYFVGINCAQDSFALELTPFIIDNINEYANIVVRAINTNVDLGYLSELINTKILVMREEPFKASKVKYLMK